MECFLPNPLLTPLFWFIVTLGLIENVALNTVNETLDPDIPALFIRPKPSMQKVIYLISTIMTFFLGVALLVYAQLSWFYLLVLVLIPSTVWVLTATKYIGQKLSQETLWKAFGIVGIHVPFYLLVMAVFVWIR